MLEFLKEYLRSPRKVGAIAPSGKGLAKKMTEPVDFDHAEVIVEYGPGTGAFTKLLFSKKRKDTKLILIEQNARFFVEMQKTYDGKEGTTVVQGSAEEAPEILKNLGFDKADVVVSGLPFASLPKKTSVRIFQATRRLIGKDGIFITFQYTLFKKKFFEQYFRIADRLFEWRNLPPAFVFVMRTKLIPKQTEEEQ